MLQLIVEGHGEVEAFPLLVRRILGELFQCHSLDVDRPIRHPKGKLMKESGLEHAIKIARRRKCRGILVLIDADKSCPKEEKGKLFQKGVSLASPIPFSSVFAKCEYETWFLAALPSLKVNAQVPPNPENIQGAKARLGKLLQIHYSPTLHQASFSEKMDLSMAFKNSRSFRKLVKDIESFIR